MWLPRTEEELRIALESGDLRESHSHELKLELGNTDGARAETARDLASLAVDGGVLIFGIGEDKERRSFTLDPFPLAGRIEALESIAELRVDPPLTILPTEIESTTNSGHGYVVVVVPPSPSAPHMVKGVYYGRGERKRHSLSDSQVMQYHRLRRADGELAAPILQELIRSDPIPPHRARNGHLHLAAVPVTAPPRIADGIAWDSELVRDLARSVDGRLPAILRQAEPVPSLLRYPLRRAQGSAWTTRGPRDADEGVGEDDLMEFEIRDDGSIRVSIGRLTSMLTRSYNAEAENMLLDTLLVASAYRVLLWASELGRRIHYTGAWDIGVAGNGMLGASSATVELQPQHQLPRTKASYPTDEFQEVARATTWDTENNIGAVVARLVGRVLRVVETTDDLRDLAR